MTISTVVSRFSSPWFLLAVTALTMLAFAANSLLTRMALLETSIDPASFSSIRLIAGAVTLACILAIKGIKPSVTPTGLLSAALLFTYAVAFSFAYRGLDTGAGALVLFASSQLLMMSFGLVRGEKTSLWGIVLALGGLIVFLLPSDTSAPLRYSAMMLVAGIAWGSFSLLGRAGGSALNSTASSFILAVPLSLALLWFLRDQLDINPVGAYYALLSGSVTSALGYVVWYWVRTQMAAITAGTVQLSVPVLSAILGVLLLDETLSLRDILAAGVVLLGVALTSWTTRMADKAAK
ncbi:DMT family transporter [Rheinheimera tangshanensis]|nr:DMT family transporter [Rheinheimera tangshanensis]GGM49435.1 membrane protein [Rheinheimera tangshanensis]